MATSTVEDYLKTILLAEGERGGLVNMGRIAEALGVAPGTVTAMVKTLAQSNLVDYEPYSGVQLTDAGRRLALHVLRRHRLVELFLVQVLGMSWSEVHREAEELEHAVSDRLIERLDEILGFPSVDPHGDPIPDAEGVLAQPQLASLGVCARGERVKVRRVSDQGESFLGRLDELGLVLGSTVTLIARDEAADTVVLENAAGQRVQLGLRAAGKIWVERPVGEPASR
ncbi:MAG: metal-dependent transcriptional regulator [Acidobacteriota bacterium]|nr:metal-dependent transcriptional regulator [Acidobacteriota bacterium]MDH3523639.1 metal-dependent transcriptional regulator [Acidobacteriota bacterium]